jgi:hypothetical protein
MSAYEPNDADGVASEGVRWNSELGRWDEYPEVDDTVHCCPDCERPNQFGELCKDCEQDRQAEIDAFTR